MKLVLLALVSSMGIAVADDAVPPECAAFTKPPEDATIPGPAIEARISLATCTAGAKLSALQLKPDDASVSAVAAATKPSLDLLDIAIKTNDPVWTPVAQRAKTDLYTAMVVRMRNSVPAITNVTVGQALTDHDQAHAAVETKVKPWLDAMH